MQDRIWPVWVVAFAVVTAAVTGPWNRDGGGPRAATSIAGAAEAARYEREDRAALRAAALAPPTQVASAAGAR
jgi:hypothetical protein